MTLRLKMALSFGALFAVILSVVSFTRTFGIPFTEDRGSYGEMRLEALRQLSLVADITKDRLSSWLGERRADASSIAQIEPLALLTRHLDEASEHLLTGQATPSEIRTHLIAQTDCQALLRQLHASLRAYKVYEKMMIAEAGKGVIVASTQEPDIGESVLGSQFFSAALEDTTKAFLDFEAHSSTASPALVVAHAISGAPSSNGVVGIVILYADAGKLLKPLLDVGARLGESGEILLLDHDQRILLSSKYPLARGNEAKAHGFSVEPESSSVSGARRGQLLETEDYRGERVLAEYRSVRLTPAHRVGILVKRDASEVFGGLNDRVIAASLISLLGILCAAGVAVWIAGWIAAPVDRLTRVAKEVAAGNLDVRVGPTAPGELSKLAATFDSMVDHIRNWHEELEKQVKERTEALTEEIAEREHTEQALRKSEERFDLAVKGTNDGIWDWFDIGGNAAWVSPRFSEMLGWPNGKSIVLVSELERLAHPDDREKWEPALRAHLENNAPYDIELRLCTSSEYRWFRIRGEAIRDATGTAIRMAGSLQDITDNKVAEEEREELIAELESKNAELERFTYTVSHDLSSPLITIKTFVGFVKDDLSQGVTETVNEDLDRVNGAAEKMSVMLDQLLELSRIGRVVNPWTHVDLNELVGEVVELLAALIAERNVRVEVAPNLPAVHGDRARLAEVLQNLIENGVKFMGDQPSPRIEVGATIHDEVPCIYVRDNGLGIDPAYHEKIFGLFDKLDDSAAGTGIGLALVKRIVEVHGGRIWVESQGMGHGSTFCFTLGGEGSQQMQSATGGNYER